MKYIFLLLIPFLSFSQEDVPSEYWIDDNDFENVINTNEAFGDDETKPVVVEFWAKFKEAGGDWSKLVGLEVSEDEKQLINDYSKWEQKSW